MKTLNCDLHVHGRHAAGVSKEMTIPVIAEQSRLKGLDVLATGDCTHKDWLEHLNARLIETRNGVFSDADEKIRFIIGTEVEDHHRVHHLVYLPDLARAMDFREQIAGFGNLDCALCGRPKLKLSPGALFEIVRDLGGIMGPAHAFTPYTGVYGYYDSIETAYGEHAQELLFLELGLSADTDLADRKKAHHSLAFLSSSDAHSPWPHRVGREFNQIRLKEPSFKELEKALRARDGSGIVKNVGLDPNQGKYHATACNACYAQYDFDFAKARKMKCPACGGAIKRGASDVLRQHADLPAGIHPTHRPPYVHMLPLADIVQIALSAPKPESKKVQAVWKSLVDEFDSEINVLLDAPVEDVARVHAQTGEKLDAFRRGLVTYAPGGGGKYGTPYLCRSPEEKQQKEREIEARLPAGEKQKRLGEF